MKVDNEYADGNGLSLKELYNHSPQWLHSQDSHHPLLTINLSNITKLSSTNYLTPSLQIQSLLEAYDLHHFIDDTHTPPPPTVTITGVASPTPTYTTWKCQDRLIFSALLSAISVSLQPLIDRTTTSLDAWQTLSNIYAKPSRGHIKQMKEQLQRVYQRLSNLLDLCLCHYCISLQPYAYPHTTSLISF
ncbi:Retrovirus-related Pol polyprotein from transposon RE1 [Vitis vinifera]|uniref:Retrovirus-related Pol polyprotein from transposon RE1 n=1 Tax=Vitis vinifera TaxID=29760 RepID=A0A438FW14_VITVI|nr:Retrovirus-related Pol polyprotein from transposon RE1 [Vitis vinifera]